MIQFTRSGESHVLAPWSRSRFRQSHNLPEQILGFRAGGGEDTVHQGWGATCIGPLEPELLKIARSQNCFQKKPGDGAASDKARCIHY